jgi:hypothetical protein
MAETTGQLDQLIERKINNKINDFTLSITDQIKKFLEDNGDSLPDQLYVGDTWEKSDTYGTKSPAKYVGVRMSDFRKSLASGIADGVKQKMINKATKELLDKVELLS